MAQATGWPVGGAEAKFDSRRLPQPGQSSPTATGGQRNPCLQATCDFGTAACVFVLCAEAEARGRNVLTHVLCIDES